MKLSHTKITHLAQERGITLTTALERAGVSRTAYYSLSHRSSVLPRTVQALAEILDVSVQELLESTPGLSLAERRLRRARDICARKPELDFHNVWHTLTLLELAPIERLEGSLRRGRGQVD